MIKFFPYKYFSSLVNERRHSTEENELKMSHFLESTSGKLKRSTNDGFKVKWDSLESD